MKIAFTGTHGTGKTTAVYELALQLKKEYPDKSVGIVLETARRCPLPINKNATRKSQLWIFTNQVQLEIEHQIDYDIVICDRSIFDVIAYTRLGDYNELADSLEKVAYQYMDSYDEIIFKKTENNQFCFADGVRDMDNDFRMKVEETLIEIYMKAKQNGAQFKLTYSWEVHNETRKF